MDFDDFIAFEMTQGDGDRGSSGGGGGTGCGTQLAAVLVILAVLSIIGGACG